MKNNLKALRTAKGMSQTDLANAAGVHRILISKIERGERELCKVQLRTGKALADAKRPIELTIWELAEKD